MCRRSGLAGLAKRLASLAGVSAACAATAWKRSGLLLRASTAERICSAALGDVSGAKRAKRRSFAKASIRRGQALGLERRAANGTSLSGFLRLQEGDFRSVCIGAEIGMPLSATPR